MTIEQLEAKIIEASQNYYSGTPIMSDNEFDALIEYLKGANPNSRILKSVGWGYDPLKNVGEKENHIYGKVSGIDKKPRSIQDIPKEFINEDILLSAKLDGLSMVCYFVDGKLVKALTRGNGEIGINRTDKVLKIVEKEFNIPNEFDFTGAIRGELCISNENWNKMLSKGIVTEDQNQRNVAAGIIGRDELTTDLEYIDLVFYKVVGCADNSSLIYNKIYIDNVMNANKYDIKFLRKFIKPEFIVDYIEDNGSLISQESLEDIYKKFNTKYLCDGIVISKRNRNIEFDKNKNYINIVINNNEIAYKFITETAETVIENIRWKMSKGNKAIPVINVAPVELSGATVSNATAFNAKYVYENDLDVGAKIVLTRSGEVIPYIIKVISGSNGNGRKKLDEMLCPFCNSKLEWDGVDLVCKNKECSNRDEQNLKVWVRTIAPIEGISETLTDSFFKELNINSLNELYDKTYMDLEYSGMASNTHKGKFNLVLDKLFNQKISFKDLLVALNIKSLGIKNAEKLASNEEFIGLFEEFMEIKDIDLFRCEGLKLTENLVGPALTNIMFNTPDGLSKFKNAFYVEHRVDFKVEEKEIMIPVVITGKLSVPRKEFEKYLNDNGYEIKSSITKDIKYLVTDNPNSGSSKNVKADELGIEKITEQDIRNIIDDKNSHYSTKHIL